MLKWYKVEAPSEEAARNILKSLRKQHLMVRKYEGGLFACVSNHHQEWLSRVCLDFGAQVKLLEEVPAGFRSPTKEEYLAPCGEKFYDPTLYSTHCRNCLKCNPKKAVPVIAKLEPGEDFNLDGVISSIEVVRDQLWERLESMDNLLGNLKVYRDTKDELSKLTAEAGKRIEAVRLLLRDNRL